MDESVPVPAATGNGNEAVADEATCHLCFDVVYQADYSPAASLPYKVHLGTGVSEGETDGSGHFRVDLVAADDYLLELGDVQMYVTAFSRTDDARTILLVGDGGGAGGASADPGSAS